MSLTPRQQQILQLIVKLYGETEEPIGSRTLLQRSVLQVSPATVRNDMMALEQLGFLMKAHSSSGRIPSYEGYQFYIDQLIEQIKQESENKPEQSSKLFGERYYDVQQFALHATNQLAQYTGYPVVVLISKLSHRRMRDFKLTKLSDYQLIASVISDHGQVESQLFDLSYALKDEVIDRIEQIIQDELIDLTLDDVYQRMKLTIPLKIQQAVSVQLNFASLIKKAIEAHDSPYYHVAGKNHLFDLIDPQLPTEGWRTLFDLIDGNEAWYQFLTDAKVGLNVTFDFTTPPYHFKNVSIVTAKSKIGNHVITFGLVGPATMPYHKIMTGMQDLLIELSNY